MKDLFPIPLYHEKSNLPIDYYRNTILELRSKQDTGKPHKDYTSFFNKDGMMNGIEVEALYEHIAQEATRLTKVVGIENIKIEPHMVGAWWNVYYQEHHCWHCHGNALWAGTLYIQMPEGCSGIVFKSPIEGLTKSWADKAFDGTRWAQEVTVSPQAGDLVMWPGWIDHTVPELFSDPEEPRISISFNISVKR